MLKSSKGKPMTTVSPNFKTRRIPKPDHLMMIRQCFSCVSGERPCQAHHLRIGEERGVALKAGDRWAVPLTMDEHYMCHRVGGKREEEWFRERGVTDVRRMALALAQCKTVGEMEHTIVEFRSR